MNDLGVTVDIRLDPKHTIVYYRTQPPSTQTLIRPPTEPATGPNRPVSGTQSNEPTRVLGTDMESTGDHKIRQVLNRLSIEEQVSLLAGSDFWRTVSIPQHGIPSIKTTDGPNGARGEFFKNGTKAALFPCGVSLAATWNPDLIERIGSCLGDETLARGANVLLGPTVGMHRSPLGGRNFESFSEDPLLTGKLAAAYIRGLQSKNVAATIKHFVGNEQETHRMTINTIVEDRALREIYLKPFEIAIREANPWALMSSYNLVNGIHSDMNHWLLQEVLREEWKYDGTVISDWTGTNSVVESVKAGCELEMPGPTKWRGANALKAIDQGKLSKHDVETAAFNVLKLVNRTKGLNGPPEPPEKSINNPDTSALIRETAAEGITLLKNDNHILPIVNAKKIAIIGPNAKRDVVGGGGSATLNPYYVITPFDGIRAATDAQLLYAQGCDSTKWLPLASEYCRTHDGQQGVILEYYHGDQFHGEPMSVQHKQTTDLFLWDSAPKDVLPAYSFKIKTVITPQSSGNHTFSFSSVGPGRLYVDGQLLIDNWDWETEGEAMFEASQDVHKTIHLEIDKDVELLVESTNEVRPASKVVPGARTHHYGGCRIGYQDESKVDLLQEAIDIARQADVVVMCVGLDAEWESEGYDRQSMDLPKHGTTDRLIEAVVAANPQTIVVNQSGNPVTMPWVDQIPGILQAWYQGQEAGHALADVLFGKQNPGGKLPTTFPKRLEDNPSFGSWPGENLQSTYNEGIFIGYRHYEAKKIKPLFPFGHGLSYTSFQYGKANLTPQTLKESTDTLVLEIPITNAGDVPGHEIVQAYTGQDHPRLARPEKELKAFSKLYLQPKETQTARMTLDKHSVSFWDPSLKTWVAEQGIYTVLIGASSADIRYSIQFNIAKTFTWTF